MSSKNHKNSSMDYTNAITDSHNEDSKALNVVAVNNLVPTRFGKVDLTYITSGLGVGNVGQARYYSDGVYQETKIKTRGDSLGTSHKTTLNFINRTAESLAGKAFVVYDNGGAVKIWFNVDFSSLEPEVTGTYRSISVNLLSSHTSEAIASRTAQAFAMDSSFVAVYSLTYTIISSSSAGERLDSYDSNTSLFIKNTRGTSPLPLINTYFYINSAQNEVEYYVWYNVGGLGTDPNIAGKTGIQVNVPNGASAEIVAQNTKTSLDSVNKFITNIDGDTLLVSNIKIGVTSSTSDVYTGFYIHTSKYGKNRELIVILEMTYDSEGNVTSVERL